MGKLNDEIRELASAKGFREEQLKPWEWAPWEISGPCPFQTAEHWDQALQLRAELIAELEARAKPKRR